MMRTMQCCVSATYTLPLLSPWTLYGNLNCACNAGTPADPGFDVLPYTPAYSVMMPSLLMRRTACDPMSLVYMFPLRSIQMPLGSRANFADVAGPPSPVDEYAAASLHVPSVPA